MVHCMLYHTTVLLSRSIHKKMLQLWLPKIKIQHQNTTRSDTWLRLHRASTAGIIFHRLLHSYYGHISSCSYSHWCFYAKIERFRVHSWQLDFPKHGVCYWRSSYFDMLLRYFHWACKQKLYAVFIKVVITCHQYIRRLSACLLSTHYTWLSVYHRCDPLTVIHG